MWGRKELDFTYITWPCSRVVGVARKLADIKGEQGQNARSPQSALKLCSHDEEMILDSWPWPTITRVMSTHKA